MARFGISDWFSGTAVDDNNHKAFQLDVNVVSAVSSGAAATGTQTQVAALTTAGGTTILAANTARKGATVYYDGAAILYLLEGSGTPTSTNYTIKMGNGFYTLYEAPSGFTGALKGIWSSAVGSANVTERTA